MTEAEQYYKSHGGCSCYTHSPCLFCMLLTEEELDILSGRGQYSLIRYWEHKELNLKGENER